MKVISKDTIYSYLEDFLDANLTKIIGNFNNGAAVATELTQETKHHFDTKISSLETSFEIHSTLQKKLFTIEEQLAMHFKGADTSSKDFLQETIGFIHTQVTEKLPEGLFLTEEGAKSILLKIPPTNFFEKTGTNLETVSKQFSFKEVLAISRQSESEAWQNDYKEILQKTSDHCFAKQKETFVVIDSSKYPQNLLHPEQKMKPWSMTHSKEAGVIVCFSSNEPPALALLQYSLVFLHYLYETTQAGNHTLTHSTKDHGDHVLKIINTTVDKLPFFNPNVYSESIFWEMAIKMFGELFPSDEFSFFENTTECGGYFNNNLISLNIIDLVWTTNLSDVTSAKKYFEKKESIFLYHFQEAFWVKLFTKLNAKSVPEMNREILTHLELGDGTLTERALL